MLGFNKYNLFFVIGAVFSFFFLVLLIVIKLSVEITE